MGIQEREGVETGAEPLGEGAVETDGEAPAEVPAEAASGLAAVPDPDPAEDPEPPRERLLQQALPGDWDTISDKFGGDSPDVAEIRLLGGKMPIEGSFEKGTEIDLLVRVRVTGILGQDLEDAYGTKKHTVRRHMARMVSVRRAR